MHQTKNALKFIAYKPYNDNKDLFLWVLWTISYILNVYQLHDLRTKRVMLECLYICV